MSRRKRAARLSSPKSAFSLVELLVVIGIITLLIAILLPVMSKASDAANRVACQSNLRQLAHAAIMRAGEHRGFMQVAGRMNFLEQAVSPNALGDEGQQRYLYYDEGNGALRPVPLQAALAPYLAKPMRTDSRAHLEEDLAADGPVKRIFACPSQGPDGHGVPGLMIAGGTTGGATFWTGPLADTSYGYNEGILGYNAGSERRLRGHLAKVKRSAETVLFADGLPRTEFGEGLPFIAWYPNDEGDCTLADAYDNAGETFNAGVRSQFDLQRHKKRMNLVFVDGHADSLLIQPGDLQKALLLAE